jgi:2-methylisocitrate lyase-like PEP mutase family enzyme
MANMVEGGKTPILSRDALGELGFKLVISPGALVRALIPAAETFLKALKAEGSTASYRDRMTDLAGVNDRIGLEDMLKLGDRYEPERQEAAE